MAFTYDLATGAGQVRLLIPDATSPGHVFEDAEIAAFLTLQAQNVFRAAAAAVETIARSQVLILKYCTVNGITTNGPAVGTELRLAAAALRAAADKAEADGQVPVIVSQAVDIFTATDLYLRQYLQTEEAG